MSVIGIENEYGISVQGRPGEDVDPVLLSAAVVTAGTPLAAGWDFDAESPLRDARGGHLPRHEALPEMLTDETRHANRLLPNGARFYVDHAHPEYSGPEVRSARDAVRWDAAGDRIVHKAAERASASLGVPVRVHKNTTDNKGASYGCHENHLVPRLVPFASIVDQFTTHLVTRTPLCGAGRVGLGQFGGTAGFQISQRADFIEARVGLETTVRRPLINTRDEPHADPRTWRRLHVITGDMLVSQVATFVKVGSASLVLQAISEGRAALPQLADPVTDMRRVSRDLALVRGLMCTDGITRTALDLQRRAWQAAHDVVGDPWIDDADEVLRVWGQMITDAQDDPASLSDRVDWAAKMRLMEGLRSRRGLEWSATELAALDLQWADCDPGVGLGQRLVRAGALQSIVDDESIAAAEQEPPVDTRAWLRGFIVSRFGRQLAGVSWDHLTVENSRGRLVGISLQDPRGDTAARWRERLEQVTSVDQLLAALGHHAGGR